MSRAWVLGFLLAACGPTIAGDDDGVDANMNVDGDGDGYPAGADCDDTNPQVNPAVPEDCDDGVDNNCNGQVDADLVCVDPCLAAAQADSYFGCELYAVDLPQY